MQGVGFRPTLYLLAQKHALTGWVLNSAHGVEIEISGSPAACAAFVNDLQHSPPPLAHIDSFDVQPAEARVYSAFEIRESQDKPDDFLPVSPDLAICPDCQRELFDPADRRYRYPFINCTNCGPRFTIVKSIPYDRPNTSMAGFALCPDCAAEYLDPTNRRFHAQPIACPVCGPQIWFEAKGKKLAEKEDALQVGRQWIAEGKILAVKGLGGFHLVCDAANAAAVQTLRERKHRTGKPFALMAFDLPTIEKYVTLSHEARRLISSPQAPIILEEMTEAGKELAQIVAPDQTRLGFMLPYTPLHLLLLEPAPGYPEVLVMTSGNLSEEPIAYDNAEARERLAGLADGFLMHNRPIYMRIDDSVVTMLREKPYLVRRARGFAPQQLRLPWQALPLLATGTELKNTFCLTRERYAFISHYIGDLENQETLGAFEQAIRHYEGVFRIQPEALACDLHPDYLATRYAQARSRAESLPLVAVQHHHAHIASCLAENGWASPEPVIGLAYDGTGYGTDGSIWGGEILIAGYKDFTRRFHLAPLPLPGGDLAVRKPARMALSYLLAAGVDIEDQTLPPVAHLKPAEVQAVRQQVSSGFNAPLTSSMGRLFDAVAALIGICEEISYEAQAAMALESAVDPKETGFYEIHLENDIIDPMPMIRAIVADLKAGVNRGRIAARFHNSLVRMSVEACRQIRNESGLRTVAISGGVWQNMRLMNLILPALEAEGFTPIIHTQLPPNDGCVSLGQAAVALSRLQG
ncbi:MAG: Hydrogenase maturation protein HypF [Anaerolineae bacterium 49_20]|nr:MAG: Hydrogenase maturation protein HypF [Anaerolineae bacterium 49_20]